jgi:hypothetical protein
MICVTVCPLGAYFQPVVLESFTPPGVPDAMWRIKDDSHAARRTMELAIADATALA